MTINAINMSDELDKQIEEYLEGRMTDPDRRSFEKKLSEVPGLSEEVADLKALEEGLHGVGMEEFQSDLRSWEEDIILPPQPGVNWKKYLAAAAVIILIAIPAIYLFLGQEPTSEELFLAYYQPYEELITTRGGSDDNVNTFLVDGMEAYNKGAYQACIDLLEFYLEQQPESHRVALYLAIAQLELNQKESAEANFLRAQEDPVFKQQAQWYQALSYLKFSETEKAKEILETIASSKIHYRNAEAIRLLKDLG